jgi:hypothetical protein
MRFVRQRSPTWSEIEYGDWADAKQLSLVTNRLFKFGQFCLDIRTKKTYKAQMNGNELLKKLKKK